MGPRWRSVRSVVLEELKLALAHLLVYALRTQDVSQIVDVLQRHPARARTNRRVARLELDDENLRILWRIAEEVQQNINRQARERLPAAAIALAISDKYNKPVEELIRTGFLSPTAIEIVRESNRGGESGDVGDSASESSVAKVIGGYTMAEKEKTPVDISLPIDAEHLSAAEAREMFGTFLEAGEYEISADRLPKDDRETGLAFENLRRKIQSTLETYRPSEFAPK